MAVTMTLNYRTGEILRGGGTPSGNQGWSPGVSVGGEGGAGSQEVVGRGARPVVLEDLDGEGGDEVGQPVVDVSQDQLLIGVTPHAHLHRTSLPGGREEKLTNLDF